MNEAYYFVVAKGFVYALIEGDLSVSIEADCPKFLHLISARGPRPLDRSLFDSRRSTSLSFVKICVVRSASLAQRALLLVGTLNSLSDEI